MPLQKIANLHLYLVTDRTILEKAHPTLSLDTAIEQAILGKAIDGVAGGVTMVQLREKNLGSRAFFDQALAVKKVCDTHRIPLIINDRVDIALAVNADGVHIGQSDLPADVVRKLIGGNKILGVTAKTVVQAQLAETQGADYLGVGAVFGTTTKADAETITIDTLKKICQSVNISVVAIGGITGENVLQLQGTGISGVAVVSGILGQKDIRGASENLREKFLKLLVR